VSGVLTGVVFDTGAVVGWTRRQPYPQTHVWTMARLGGTVVVPAAVLTAAHALVPGPEHDVLEALLDLPQTLVPAVDRVGCLKVGTVLRERNNHEDNPDELVSAAHAVAEARSRNWYVLTDRAKLLTALIPEVLFDTLP
jgi:hypothetical protein